ncbi:hypothetical protein [Paenibacillus sp. S28]|uniref:hypothetical protein n=1 Tax=Paenibacillus sp. S28 TaxID=2767463 RepID=UPI00190A32F5|nr:hypothetical protein [Paenibacillus sp. S28]MBJ9991294.1 hypothetical protein [Paenibacillus sp. S28]
MGLESINGQQHFSSKPEWVESSKELTSLYGQNPGTYTDPFLVFLWTISKLAEPFFALVVRSFSSGTRRCKSDRTSKDLLKWLCMLNDPLREQQSHLTSDQGVVYD